jgi:transglutaminase-like putative cysteine protease
VPNRAPSSTAEQYNAMLQLALPPSIKVETVTKVISYFIGLMVFAGIYEHIHLIFAIAFLIITALSIYFEYSGRFYIPRWLLTLGSLSVLAFSIYRLNTNELMSQMLEALLIFLAIKFLEDKKFRDYMQIYAICIFLLAGLGLLTLSIVFLVYFLAIILLLCLSIILLTFSSEEPGIRFDRQTLFKVLSKCLFIPLVALPLTAFMFIILPRSQYPLLHFLNRADRATTGFTDRVKLGTVSGIQEDASAIMRVNMERVNEENLYWRGIVLDSFDGTDWKTAPVRELATTRQGLPRGRVIQQTVYLEPYGNNYLFTLDKPLYVALRDARKFRDLTIISPRYLERRFKYDVYSVLSDRIIEKEVNLERHLQVPEHLSGRIKDLVKSLVSQTTKEDIPFVLYRYLGSPPFAYSLKDLPVSENPLEDFLFETKKGNCEYFASAYAIMLRLAGIPSRLVGGYRGGYYNDVGGYYLVPQKNAHVWVEVHLKGSWVRMDPTPASLDTFTTPASGDLFFRMRVFFDTVNYYWYAMIINYDFQKQLFMLYKLRTAVKKPTFTSLKMDRKKVGTYVIGILTIAAILWAAVFLIKKKKTQEAYLLSKFFRKMERYGYRKRRSEGLEEFVETIVDENLRTSAFQFVREFEGFYFRDASLRPKDSKRLAKLIRAINPEDPQRIQNDPPASSP